MTERFKVIDRRTALLNASVEQIALKGARGMRVEEVARSAGVSAALIYHHFEDRSTLLRAALEHVGKQAGEYTKPVGKHPATGRGLLTERLLAEIQDKPEVRINSAAWGELRDSAIFDKTLQPTFARLTAEWVSDIAELVRQGQDDRSVKKQLDPDATAFTLTVLVEGISGRWLTGILTTKEARKRLLTCIELCLG